MRKIRTKKLVFILGGWLQKDRDGSWRSPGFEQDADTVSGYGAKLRVLAAKYLLDENPDGLLVPSGSKGKLAHIPDVPNVAEVMRQELLVLGVADQKIVKEEKGHSTYQQIMELKKLIRDLGAEKVIIVSNRYHLPRSEAFVRKDEELSGLLQTGRLVFAAAEDVVLRHDREHWEEEIVSAYKSDKMNAIIAQEEKGVKHLKQGTYKYV